MYTPRCTPMGAPYPIPHGARVPTTVPPRTTGPLGGCTRWGHRSCSVHQASFGFNPIVRVWREEAVLASGGPQESGMSKALTGLTALFSLPVQSRKPPYSSPPRPVWPEPAEQGWSEVDQRLTLNCSKLTLFRVLMTKPPLKMSKTAVFRLFSLAWSLKYQFLKNRVVYCSL